jgi:hypothetical protein
MTRAEMMGQIERLITESGEDNRETLAASAVLMALLGAMYSGHEVVLLDHVSHFSAAYVEAAKGGKE